MPRTAPAGYAIHIVDNWSLDHYKAHTKLHKNSILRIQSSPVCAGCYSSRPRFRQPAVESPPVQRYQRATKASDGRANANWSAASARASLVQRRDARPAARRPVVKLPALLQLPQEIRLLIYEYLDVANRYQRPIWGLAEGGSLYNATELQDLCELRFSPSILVPSSLLRTCKFIYLEARDWFYRTADFALWSQADQIGRVGYWLRHHPISLTSRLTVYFGVSYTPQRLLRSEVKLLREQELEENLERLKVMISRMQNLKVLELKVLVAGSSQRWNFPTFNAFEARHGRYVARLLKRLSPLRQLGDPEKGLNCRLEICMRTRRGPYDMNVSTVPHQGDAAMRLTQCLQDAGVEYDVVSLEASASIFRWPDCWMLNTHGEPNKARPRWVR